MSLKAGWLLADFRSLRSVVAVDRRQLRSCRGQVGRWWWIACARQRSDRLTAINVDPSGVFRMRVLRAAVAPIVLLGLVGCGGDKPPLMPSVVDLKLDVALSDIERAGFSNEVEVLGGGLLGVIDKSNWTVCQQEPAAGQDVEKPRLTVDRACAIASPSVSPSTQETPAPTQSPPEPAASPTFAPSKEVTDLTVDELVDKLNSENMGGIKSGDLFRVTGELVGSRFWATGASGDHFVNLKTSVGSDLIVFVEESETVGWTDGVKVEMILESVSATINGETTEGWMRSRTARVCPINGG